MIQLKQVHWRRSSFLLVATHQFLSLCISKTFRPIFTKVCPSIHMQHICLYLVLAYKLFTIFKTLSTKLMSDFSLNIICVGNT